MFSSCFPYFILVLLQTYFVSSAYFSFPVWIIIYFKNQNHNSTELAVYRPDVIILYWRYTFTHSIIGKSHNFLYLPLNFVEVVMTPALCKQEKLSVYPNLSGQPKANKVSTETSNRCCQNISLCECYHLIRSSEIFWSIKAGAGRLN